MPQTGIYTGCLHHASVLGDVAEEYSQSAVLGIGVVETADASVLAVGVKALPLRILRAHLGGELAAWSTVIDAVCLRVKAFACDVILSHGLFQGHAVHTFSLAVDESAAVEFTKDTENTTGTVALLHTILLGVGRELAQARHLTTQLVNVGHLEICLCLLCHCQQMEHGVGAAAHGDVEGHGIEESIAGGYAAGQHTLVTLFIIFQSILHDETGSILEELDTVLVRGKNCAVARQGKTDGLGERVHGVGGEHARAATATRTCTTLYLLQVFVAASLVATVNHSGDKVCVLTLPASGLHRTATAEHGRYVQSHGCHEHTRSNLVAVGNANHGICLVGIDHILYRVGNDVA